jgi:hypothetical protein
MKNKMSKLVSSQLENTQLEPSGGNSKIPTRTTNEISLLSGFLSNLAKSKNLVKRHFLLNLNQQKGLFT